MVRRLTAWLRARGVDIRSRHRIDASNVMTVVRRLLSDRPVRVVVDCGAHHARMSRDCVRVFPDATVYAFEPTPATYKAMVGLVRGIERIVPVHAALGAHDGDLAFHVKADDEQSNSALAFADGGGVETRVPCRRLDAFCRERGIEHIGFMKIDVEGFELSVLAGAAGLMSRGAVDVILAEVRPEPVRPGAATLLTMSQHLDALGYHLVGIYHMLWHPNLLIDWFDALWVSGATYRRYTGSEGRHRRAPEIPEVVVRPAASRAVS